MRLAAKLDKQSGKLIKESPKQRKISPRSSAAFSRQEEEGACSEWFNSRFEGAKRLESIGEAEDAIDGVVREYSAAADNNDDFRPPNGDFAIIEENKEELKDNDCGIREEPYCLPLE